MPVIGTTTAKVTSTFSANLTCHTIADYLVSKGFQAINHFGLKQESLEKIFRELRTVHILYDGCDYIPEANRAVRMRIRLTFLIVDYTLGQDADKNSFLIDEFRQYIMAGPEGWQDFGLSALYTALNVEPFICESENVMRFEDGYSWTIFTGYIQLHQDDLV